MIIWAFEKRSSQINDLSFSFKLEEEQIKPKLKRRKQVIKVRSDGNRKTIEKINETKLVFKNDCTQPRRQNEFNRLQNEVSNHLCTNIITNYREILNIWQTTNLLFFHVTRKKMFFLFSRKSGTNLSSLFTLPDFKAGWLCM